MTYEEILSEIARQEHCSENQVEKELYEALRQAHLECSPKELIENITNLCHNGRYIV